MAMDERKDLIEARRLISMLIRVCRQTHTFFDGISAMDQNRVKRLLRDAIRESETYLSSPR